MKKSTIDTHALVTDERLLSSGELLKPKDITEIIQKMRANE